MTDTQWLDREISTARELLNQAHQFLQRGNLETARGNIDEAIVVLDMADAEAATDDQRQLRARALNERGLLYQHSNQTSEAFRDHRQAADLLDRLEDVSEDFLGSAAAIHLNYSQLLVLDEDYAAARYENKKALEYVDRLEEADGDGSLSLGMGAHQNMTALESFQKNFDGAEEHAEEAIAIAEQMLEVGGGQGLTTAARVCQQLSVQYFETEQFDKAVQWGRRAEELSERAYQRVGAAALDAYLVSQINLISYYEQHHQYADAEDCLWKAIDVAGPDEEIVERGLMFYQNCRKQADGRLEKGNLPREEVEDGYKELQEIAQREGIID